MLSHLRWKKLVPTFIRSRRRRARDRQMRETFAGMSNRAIFEKIYDENRWGHPDTPSRRYSSGDGSRDRKIVTAYLDAVFHFLADKPDLYSAIDLGCGDFSVGSQLIPRFGQFIAADVATNVLEENRTIFSDTGLTFLEMNITEDPIPAADVIFVRQVLQHLSNAEILKFLDQIRGKFKYLIVTESISKSVFFSPNRDCITGPGIRIHQNSGVVLEAAPFRLESARVETLLQVSKGRELIVTKAYKG